MKSFLCLFDYRQWDFGDWEFLYNKDGSFNVDQAVTFGCFIVFGVGLAFGIWK
jgi:hypothetical protein